MNLSAYNDLTDYDDYEGIDYEGIDYNEVEYYEIRLELINRRGKMGTQCKAEHCKICGCCLLHCSCPISAHDPKAAQAALASWPGMSSIRG